jgi:hypothetical protein
MQRAHPTAQRQRWLHNDAILWHTNKYEHSQKALFHLSSPAAHACLSRSTYVTSPLARSERRKESKANGIKPFSFSD